MFDLSKALHRLSYTFIEHPFVLDVTEQISLHHKYGRRRTSAEAIALLGPSGSGKTLTIDRYVRSIAVCDTFVPSEDQDSTVKQLPVLKVETPANATLKGLAEAILAALNDPVPSRGTEQAMTQRIENLLRARKVQLLILDELQHLVERRGNSSRCNKKAADWLKSLMNITAIPIVLSGTSAAEEVISADEQILLRCPKIMRFQRFGYTKQDEIDAFQQILLSFEECLDLPSPSSLAAPDTAARIHYASQGLMGGIYRLLSQATIYSAHRKGREISRTDLSNAFELGLPSGTEQVNPFLTEEPPLLRPKAVDVTRQTRLRGTGRKKLNVGHELRVR